ncbi:type VI secretion system Vgr family protein [Herbaspirillum rubrisubalbicans]|uniref:type VI secretion system Vgr family protein n=1 Tax=Herbaspirillum rubrisubalbicans TaxID=80842 RepID=UPI000DD3E18E|nr:type VI secretion system Vgr family protein [Herbaspirillum rubrisubalbicans]
MSLPQALLQHQHNRLLRLSFPHDDAPSSTLMINRFHGTESMSRDFHFTLELLSDDAAISLESLMGKLVCVSLVLSDGGLRPFSGYVSSFRFVRTDGGIVFYEAVLVPWLHYARLRQNNRLFHQQTIEQQTESILKDYGILPRWRWQVAAEPHQYTMCTQWEESDHNYLSRRWEAEGYCYWYEHTEQGHTLVVADDSTAAQAIDGLSDAIRFHSKDGAQEEDAIAQWQAVRQWASSQVAVSGFDFKHPYPRHVDIATINQQGDIARMEVHSYAGHYGLRNFAHADQLARQRMEEIEARGLHYEAQGNHRQVAAGRRFRLQDHFQVAADDEQFLILEVEHEASNNYLQGADVPATYRNRMRCQPLPVPWRPGGGFDSIESRILAPQTAVVVGPQGKGSLHVDQYGRVQLRFHWDRQPSSSCWVRVATNWAGARSGLSSHPRVGAEVVVQWLDGNPDHPLVTGCVHNEANMPPWELPQQQALSGLRSRELTPEGGNAAGGRSNHVILDDSWERMQVQIRSDHQSSQLSLGHITRIDDHAGRKDGRGQGFELRTDGQGALRAQHGLLITTEGRPDAQGHITAMEETTARLEQSGQWHAELAQAAQQAGAQQAGDQDVVAEALRQQNDAIRGRRKLEDAGFPEFEQAHLTLASPVGIEAASGGSIHVSSQQHTALSSAAHASISAGKSLLVSVREAVRIFAYKAGMKLLAVAADIDISALRQSVNIFARLNITHTANRISITAKEEIFINGGGSTLRLSEAGIHQRTSGHWQAHAAQYAHDGPANEAVPALPDPPVMSELKQQQRLSFQLKTHCAQGRGFMHEPYVLFKDGVQIAMGVSDAHGLVVIEGHTPGPARYAVKLSNGCEFELPAKPGFESDDERLVARGYGALHDDAQDLQRHRALREG